MSTISAVKSWASNEVLTASDLNAEFSNLISSVNNLNADNLDLTANYTFTGNLQGANVTAATAFLPDASGGADIGSTSLEFGDVFLADGKAIKFGSDQDITVTHVADTGLTMAGAHANGTNLQLNNTATDGDAVIQFALSGTVAYSLGVEDGDSDKFVINYGTGALGAQPALEIDSSGNTSLAGTLGTSGAATLASLVCTAGATFGGGTGSSGATITTAGAGTFDGIIKTEDTTEATSTTDGSLQTDGGLSVAKDAIIGDDLKLLSDSAVLSLGDGSDATLTHDGTTGVTIAANPITFDSGAALTLDAHTGVFVFKDAGSEVLRFTEGNSGDVTIKLATNGKDLVFTDNGDATNMKILDAAAGINVPGEVQTTKVAYTDGDDALTIADGGGVTTASTLAIGTVAAAGEDTDKFLVLDSSGNVDYRTGTQVASDIGAGSVAADDIATGDGAVDIVTTSGNITLDAQANDADVIIKVDDGGSAVTALTLDGSDEGNAIFVNDVQLKSDSALLEFGADLDTTLTHTDGTGLTLNSTNKLTFGDAASFVQQSADGTLRIDGEAIIDLNASTRVDVSGDLKVGGEVQTANIGYTDGDNAITIADGGGVTFPQAATFTSGFSNNEQNITNVGDIAVDTISGDDDSNTTIGFPGSDVLTLNTGGSERLRCDANGIFGIGTNTATTYTNGRKGLVVADTSGSADVGIVSGTSGVGYLSFSDTADATHQGYLFYDHSADMLASSAVSLQSFRIGGAEKMRIASDGDTMIGTTDHTSKGRFGVVNSVAEYTAAFWNSNASSPYGLNLHFSGAAPNNSDTNHFLHCHDNAADRLRIWSNGDVQNANNSYGVLSSEARLKQDITDARSYWDDFKQLRYKKFRMIADVEANPDAPYRLGLIADEAYEIFPQCTPAHKDMESRNVAVLDEDGNATYEQTEKRDADGNVELDADGNAVMVDKVDDDGNPIPITESKIVDLGTTTKGIKNSIIEGPIMGRVVQELQARLEAAETKIVALEAA